MKRWRQDGSDRTDRIGAIREIRGRLDSGRLRMEPIAWRTFAGIREPCAWTVRRVRCWRLRNWLRRRRLMRGIRRAAGVRISTAPFGLIGW